MKRYWRKKYPIILCLGIFSIIIVLPTPGLAHCTLYANYWYRYLERWILPTYVESPRDPAKGHDKNWRLHLANFPEDLRPRVQELTQSGIHAWNNVGNHEYRFGNLEVVANEVPPLENWREDNVNRIFYDQSGDYFYNQCLFPQGHERAGQPQDAAWCLDLRHTLGMTFLSPGWGQIDIVINGKAARDLEGREPFHLVPTADDIRDPMIDYSFWTLVTHELGHATGLAHFGGPPPEWMSGCGPLVEAVMAPWIMPIRDLQPEDRYAIQWLYPPKEVFYPPLVVGTLRHPDVTIRTDRYLIDTIVIGSGDGTVGSAALDFQTRPEGGNWVQQPGRAMQHTQSPGPIYSGVLPGQPRGSEVQYRVVAESPNVNLSEGREPWPGIQPPYFSFRVVQPDPNYPWFEPVPLAQKLDKPFYVTDANWVDADFDGDLDLFFTSGAYETYGVEPYQFFKNFSDREFSLVKEIQGLQGIRLPNLYPLSSNIYQLSAWLPFLNGENREDIFTKPLHLHRAPARFQALQGDGPPAEFLQWPVRSWGDLDGDGKIELIIVPPSNITDSPYNNGGDCDYVPDDQVNFGFRILSLRGGGEPIEWEDLVNRGFLRHGRNTRAMGIADYDRDGDFDLLQRNSCGKVLLYRNNGIGHFEEVSEQTGLAQDQMDPNNPWRSNSQSYWHSKAFWIDFNNDGWIDICSSFPVTRCFENLGNGTFTVASNLWTLGTKLNSFSSLRDLVQFDFNNDGLIDFIYSDLGQRSDPVTAIRKLTEDLSGFDEATRLAVGEQEDLDTFYNRTENIGLSGFGEAISLAVGDYNEDGGLDLLAQHNNYHTQDVNRIPEVFKLVNLNPRNHWIKFWVDQRRTPNDGGVGSEVIVTTHRGGVQTQYVHVADNMSRELHFGLGEDSEWKTIAIRWAHDPNGHIEHVNHRDHHADREIGLVGDAEWMSGENLPPKVWFVNDVPVSHLDEYPLALEAGGENIEIKLQSIDPEMDRVAEIRTQFDGPEFEKEVIADPRGYLTIRASGQNWGAVHERTITVTPVDARGGTSTFRIRVRRGNPLPDLVVDSAGLLRCVQYSPNRRCSTLRFEISNRGTTPINAGTRLHWKLDGQPVYDMDSVTLEAPLQPQEHRVFRVEGERRVFPGPGDLFEIDARNVVHEENENNNTWRRQ